MIEAIDALGARTINYYDDLDRKVVELNALGAYRLFSYDDAGNLLTSRTYATPVALPTTPTTPPATPGGGYRETINSYDALNRLKTVKSPT